LEGALIEHQNRMCTVIEWSIMRNDRRQYVYVTLKDLKIKGNKGMKQLRPMCCREPFSSNEYTILAGAIEKDGRLVPADVKEAAQANRKELVADPTRRVHERLTEKPEE